MQYVIQYSAFMCVGMLYTGSSFMFNRQGLAAVITVSILALDLASCVLPIHLDLNLFFTPIQSLAGCMIGELSFTYSFSVLLGFCAKFMILFLVSVYFYTRNKKAEGMSVA